MGDRIVISITDGESVTPSFYGHWCGLRAVKTLNDLIRNGDDNGINSLMCNFVVEIMEGKPRRYSYYLYNRGEADEAADWDNYHWNFNTKTQRWKTTVPELAGRELTMDEADTYVKDNRPCLYRECKCENYGKEGCSLRFYETHGKT